MRQNIFTSFFEQLFLACFYDLPKFAQILNWWRHTGRRTKFWTSRPKFLDSSVNFTWIMILPCVVRQETWYKLDRSFICLFSTITLHFACLAPVTSSKTSLKPLVCLQFRAAKKRKNRLNSNACSFVKNQYFLMRFFFVRFVMISSFDLANKNRG